MTRLLFHPVTPIWLLLVSATGLSWWLGTQPSENQNLSIATTIVIIVAFVKVRFVIRYFMEVREAGVYLKLICDGWVMLICGVILALYWQVF